MRPGRLGRDGGGRLVDGRGVAPARGHLRHPRVGDGREQHLVLGRQQVDVRHQSLLDRGRIEVGQQHDQAALPGDAEHGGGHQRDVGLDEVGLEQRQLARERGQHRAAPGADDPGPHPPVRGDQVDPVTRARGQRGQQQRGVHRRVEPRDAADPAGRRAAGVQHDHDPAVPLRPPGPHDDIRVARRRPPVDRPDIVAEHVGAERVELAALPADHRLVLPVELAEPGQLLGQMLAGQERRQHPDGQRRGHAALPAGQAERAERADGDQPRAEVAAPLRGQRRGQPWPGRPAGRSIRVRPGRAPALGRQPSLTDSAQPAPAGIDDGHRRRFPPGRGGSWRRPTG